MHNIIIQNIQLLELSNEEIEMLENEYKIYGFIYITKNLINNKLYIGQRACSPKWKTYLGSGIKIKRAIKKYGRENFKRYVIDFAFDYDSLNELEYIYSIMFNVIDDDNWYNLMYGGGFHALKGIKFSDEHRRRIAEAKKGEKNPNYGKKYSESEIEIMREKSSGVNNAMYGKRGKLSPNYGKKHSDETKKKMSLAAIGEKNHNYHKQWTDEQKDKLRKHYEKYGNPNDIKTYCYDLSGHFIKSYKSAKVAAEELNLHHSSICKICRNQKGKCGNYQWRYASDVNYSEKDINPYRRFDNK